MKLMVLELESVLLRANGYHILSLIFAGLGSIAWSLSDADRPEYHALASALWLASASAGLVGTRRVRREREGFVRQLRRAAAAIQPIESQSTQAPVSADTLAAAVEGLIAASRAQTSRLMNRLQEMEIELRAATLEQDHAHVTFETINASLKETQKLISPPPAWEMSTGNRGSYKSEFVSLMSHELRTPLTSIHAYSEILLGDEAIDAASQREFVNIIHTEAGRLGQAITNLLSLARLETGAITPQLGPVSFGPVLREALKIDIPQKPVAIDVTVDPAVEAVEVAADATLLRQAVRHILDHLSRHVSDDKRLRVCAAVDVERNCVLLQIMAAGLCISPKDLPFVFDSFYGGVDDLNRRTGAGTGADLVLVRQVIERAHGGRLIAASDSDGCTLGFELPALATAPRVATAAVRDGTPSREVHHA